MGARFDAWQRVREFLSGRRQHYNLTFNTPHGNAVLRDLAKWCRANETCFDPDPRIHAVLEGRREVWLRITEHLTLNPEQLATKYGQPKPDEDT